MPGYGSVFVMYLYDFCMNTVRVCVDTENEHPWLLVQAKYTGILAHAVSQGLQHDYSKMNQLVPYTSMMFASLSTRVHHSLLHQRNVKQNKSALPTTYEYVRVVGYALKPSCASYIVGDGCQFKVARAMFVCMYCGDLHVCGPWPISTVVICAHLEQGCVRIIHGTCLPV